MKRRKFKILFCLGISAILFLFSLRPAIAQGTGETSAKTEPTVPKSELDNLKAEWEAVREQQIQMIREKEDQLEKLKEEIFAKMKALNVTAAPQPVVSQPAVGMPAPILPIDNSGAAVPANSSELEAQKAALQVERQKFFNEMNRQKESLRQLQSSLDEKAKQLDAERALFEQAKKTAV